MKTLKLERKMKRKLAGLGLEVRPGSPTDRGLIRVARIGTRFSNTGRCALRAAERAIGDTVESARARLHEASRPSSGDTASAQAAARRKAAAGTRKRTLRPRAA